MITKRLGELLIEQGHISQNSWVKHLKCRKCFRIRPLAALCVWGTSGGDLSLVLDQKNKRRKLADILLKKV